MRPEVQQPAQRRVDQEAADTGDRASNMHHNLPPQTTCFRSQATGHTSSGASKQRAWMWTCRACTCMQAKRACTLQPRLPGLHAHGCLARQHWKLNIWSALDRQNSKTPPAVDRLSVKTPMETKTGHVATG